MSPRLLSLSPLSVSSLACSPLFFLLSLSCPLLFSPLFWWLFLHDLSSLLPFSFPRSLGISSTGGSPTSRTFGGRLCCPWEEHALWVTGGTRHGFHRLVLLLGAWGDIGRESRGRRGNFKKSCKKVQKGHLDSGTPGKDGGRAQTSNPARCAVVWKWMHINMWTG